MDPCRNCGKLNTFETNFCRFCGTKFEISRPGTSAPGDNYNLAAPRPYAWKTDEYQTQNEARYSAPDFRNAPAVDLAAGRQAGNAQPYAPIMQAPQYAVDPNYHCPRCGSSYLPVIDRRISTAGWVVFSVLLVFTIIFFWVGLCMKEDVAVCPVCRSRVS